MRRFGSATLVAALASCGLERTGQTAVVSVLDSAGVEIVNHPAGFEQSLPAWTATELVTDIGGPDGPEYEFDRARGALRLSDGRIVVANAGSSELRFFDSGGRYLSATGRQGNGPGEFAALETVERLPGDTLVTLDGQLRRFSLFSPTGALRRTTTVLASPEQGYITASAPLTDGRFLGGHYPMLDMRETSGPVRRTPFAVGIIGADATGFDTLVVAPGLEMYPGIGHEAGQTFPTLHSLQFGRSTQVVTDGFRIYVGTNEADGISVYGTDGRLLRMIRGATTPELVTEEHRAQRLRETLANFERSRAPEQIKADWKKNAGQILYAEVFPDYERLLIGTDGTLWQERARRAADEGRRYIVYDSAGRAVATVRCPERFRPYQVGPDEIIGVWRDPDEVQHVRVYRVVRNR